VNDQDPPITFDDGMRASRVVMAGYKSAAMHQPVSIAQ
jgi:predicted dehydrogenase